MKDLEGLEAFELLWNKNLEWVDCSECRALMSSALHAIIDIGGLWRIVHCLRWTDVARVCCHLCLLQTKRRLQDHFDLGPLRQIDLITALQQDRAKTQSRAQSGAGQ